MKKPFKHPFQNPDLPAEERIDNLISLMTLKEKISCLTTRPDVPRLGVVGTAHSEGLHGLAQGGPGGWGRPSVIPTTTFPQAVGLGYTWDPALLRTAAAAEGYEARYVFQNPDIQQQGLVIRAPNADLVRDPRWGRSEESYGEDPFFNGTMAVAFVKGLQGNHPRYWLSASLLKHFLANSNENNRENSSSDFDERLWREYYSVPFRMAVTEGGSNAYMAAYNAWNGVPCAVHPMLKEITAKEWGVNGIICTDGGAYRLLVTSHKYFPDLEKAGAACIRAGINQFLDRFIDEVTAAVAHGLLTEGEIDAVIRGNFRVMIKLGQLDPADQVPYASIGRSGDPAPWLSKKNRALARRVTQKSIVLLKNENNLLPLDTAKIKKIAVIGRRADEVLLDWYSGTPPYVVTPLKGIQTRAGAKIEIKYAANNGNSAAARLAATHDIAIVCVGNHPTCDAGWEISTSASEGKEGVDRSSLSLEDEELVRQVYAVNKKTIVVLMSSFPYAINWTKKNIPAIIHMAHNSQETGTALADVLFGDYNPAGRLTVTWPASIKQLPPMMDYNIRHGRTYLYSKSDPLFPFGFGLSYTRFSYSNLRTSSPFLSTKGAVTVHVDIKNSGKRDGEEVIQLYVKFLDSAVERPQIQLAGFKRVFIKKGKTKSVAITLAAKRLAYWDVACQKFIVEKGSVEILIGASSKDIRLKKKIRIQS